MNSRLHLRFAATFVAAFAWTASQASVVAYREIFAHTGTNPPDFTNGQPTNGGLTPTIGWYLRRPNMVGHITASATGAPINTVASGIGISSTLAAVNAGPQQGTQVEKGFAVIPGSTAQTADVVPNATAYVMYTTEFSLALGSVEQISWYQGNHLATDVWRAAIQIDSGQWFVSDGSFTNSPVTNGTSFPTLGEFKQVDFATAQWRTLDFQSSLAANSGSLALGSVTALSGSQITAFGMFTDSKNNNMRFDTYQINAVPEPASLAVIGLGLAAISRRRLSRNH